MRTFPTINDPALHMPSTIPALDPAKLATTPGVQLTPRGGRLLVSLQPTAPGASPSPAAAFDPFSLPVLPGPLLDAMATVCRFGERRTGGGAAFLLYLDPLGRSWSTACPAPQPALTGPSVKQLLAKLAADHAPLLIDPRPEHEHPLLLAGGYLVTPTSDAEMVARQVPEVDGLWLFHRAGSWAHVGAFARIEGRPHVLDPLDVAADYCADGRLHPHDRPWIPSPV